MILFFAILTIKSLRLLIETAKHVDVSSYERLAEVGFGPSGFVFISVAMFIMSYGAMVGYLMIVKENLSILLGVDESDVYMSRAVLTISSMIIMLPLCLQRDISALSKTSGMSVAFDCILVLIVGKYSPVPQTIREEGGLVNLISNHSNPNGKTFFIGIGVLCFAFVCQHSAFIIAASLDKPTKQRWNKVTGSALTTCAVLAVAMGVAGYLGFLDDTDGDVLVNLGRMALTADDATKRASNIARGLLCTTMFFVYPVELFVARHVCVVLFFKGRRAHEGDDHSVLARRDRRVAITLALYLLSLAPALLCNDLGSVFSVSGSLGGSALSYVGPGMTYLGIHGADFLELVSSHWIGYIAAKHLPSSSSNISAVSSISGIGGSRSGLAIADMESGRIGGYNSAGASPSTSTMTMISSTHAGQMAGEEEAKKKNILFCFVDFILWYILGMPLWCKVAIIGKDRLEKHREDQALKSPMPYRFGKIIHHGHGGKNNKAVASQPQVRNLIGPNGTNARMFGRMDDKDDDDSDNEGELQPLLRNLSFQDHKARAALAKGKMALPALPRPSSAKGSSATSRSKVGFALGPNHSAINEKKPLDRSRPMTPDSFSVASFEVMRGRSSSIDSNGGEQDGELSIQEELKLIKKENSTKAMIKPKHTRTPSDLSLTNSLEDGITYDDDDESEGSSIFVSEGGDSSSVKDKQATKVNSNNDADIDVLEDGSTSISLHFQKDHHQLPPPTTKKLPLPIQQDQNYDSIPKIVKASSSAATGMYTASNLGKVKAPHDVMKRMHERGNVISVNVMNNRKDEDGEDDPQDDIPSKWDFVLAIVYILFGAVAASAGLFSAFIQ